MAFVTPICIATWQQQEQISLACNLKVAEELFNHTATTARSPTTEPTNSHNIQSLYQARHTHDDYPLPPDHRQAAWGPHAAYLAAAAAPPLLLQQHSSVAIALS